MNACDWERYFESYAVEVYHILALLFPLFSTC